MAGLNVHAPAPDEAEVLAEVDAEVVGFVMMPVEDVALVEEDASVEELAGGAPPNSALKMPEVS